MQYFDIKETEFIKKLIEQKQKRLEKMKEEDSRYKKIFNKYAYEK